MTAALAITRLYDMIREGQGDGGGRACVLLSGNIPSLSLKFARQNGLDASKQMEKRGSWAYLPDTSSN
jgi:hypothetical protein